MQSENKFRTLAAIMFTDIVGYTALMQRDENAAKDIVNKHRSVLEENISAQRGRIIQYYGDGTLSIFGSAIESVKCAIEIQKVLQEEPKIPLRIGIHLGDIVYEDDGAYGDGVNVASRIESLSEPGAILISEKVNDELSSHPEIASIPLGSYELKNVKQPVSVFTIDAPGVFVPNEEKIQAKAGLSKTSIAVLPFVNMSSDPENEYFSDGMTEELLNALAKFDGLRVTARTSSFAFKGKNKDIRQIGDELNVKTILEGSVRKAGNRVRVTAQLINISNGFHLFSETYDRNLDDIFALQDELSNAIAQKLCKSLHLQPKGGLRKKVIENIEAYNYYLKGKYYWNKWSPDGFKKAILSFEKAIELEPNFAEAYSWIACCYIVLQASNLIKVDNAYEKARELANLSYELDNTISATHATFGLIKLFADWDWDGAYRSFQEAFRLQSEDADNSHAYTMYLTVTGQKMEAIEEAKKAVSLDPLSLPSNKLLGHAYYNAERYDEAIEQLKKTIELDSNFVAAYSLLAMTYLMKGDKEKALESIKKFEQKVDDDYDICAIISFIYAKAGQKDRAVEYIEMIKESEAKNPDLHADLDLSIAYLGIGEKEKALDHLERAFDLHLDGLIFINAHPGWKELEDEPRFKALLKHLKLS